MLVLFTSLGCKLRKVLKEKKIVWECACALFPATLPPLPRLGTVPLGITKRMPESGESKT